MLRDSTTSARITLPRSGLYDISAPETVSVGVPALATSSGHSAQFLAINNITTVGDTITVLVDDPDGHLWARQTNRTRTGHLGANIGGH